MDKAETSNNSPEYDRRPWGSFTVLDEGENYKVKRIEVLPGKRLSYQQSFPPLGTLVRRPRHS